MAEYKSISVTHSGEVPEAKIFNPSEDPSRTRQLVVAFSIILLPVLAIPSILLAFFLYSDIRPNLEQYSDYWLPTGNRDISSSDYYTTKSDNHVLVVSGLASTAGPFLIAPFMLLFSFFVAKARVSDGVHSYRADAMSGEYNKERVLLDGINKGAWPDIIKGFFNLLGHGFRRESGDRHHLHVAAMGATLIGTFTHPASVRCVLTTGRKLNKLADNAVNFYIYTSSNTLYQPITVPNGQQDYDDLTLTTFLPWGELDCQNVENLCAVNRTGNVWNVQDAVGTFSVLDYGITEVTSGFGLDQKGAIDLQRSLQDGNASDVQVVTYDKDSQLHAFLFNMTAAGGFYEAVLDQELDYYPHIELPQDALHRNWGLDFKASTFSMVTDCRSATQDCHMSNAKSNDTSLPFNCSSMFSGDVLQVPMQGIDQFRGWNTSFYQIKDGQAVAIQNEEAVNPFLFNATGAITSIDYETLQAVRDRQVINHEIVDAGSGRVAFALHCESTVYNVTYSVVDGNIARFNATPSEPWVANIMKVPLQVGLGRFRLFQDASLAALLNQNTSIADAMSLSFSRVGVALSSGAFATGYSLEQRQRAVWELTGLSKAVFWFMVAVCLLYAALAIVILVAAFALRRNNEYKKWQIQIMAHSAIFVLPSPKSLAKGSYEKVKQLFS